MSTTTINTTVLENEGFRELTANELTAAQGGTVALAFGTIEWKYVQQKAD